MSPTNDVDGAKLRSYPFPLKSHSAELARSYRRKRLAKTRMCVLFENEGNEKINKEKFYIVDFVKFKASITA